MPDYMVPVRVSEIGEFIRFRSCERRFKLGLDNRRLARSVPFSERLFNALDPVLQGVGREAEDAWERALRTRGVTNLLVGVEPEGGARAHTWETFRAALAIVPAGTLVYGREIELSHGIGTFALSGRIDFLVLLWDRGTPRLRIVEGKASRKDRTYHRLQLAAYVTMLRRLVREEPLVVAGQPIDEDSIEGVVVRIDEITNEPQDMIDRQALNLDIEIADLERLLSSNGLLAAIVDTDLNALDYQLDPKCDGCVFNVHCLPESARLRRLELTGLPPTTCRILRQTGVATIDDLAALDPQSPSGQAVRQAPGFDANVAQLVATAAARRSTLPRGEGDPDNFQVVSLPHSGAGQLPLHEMQGQRLVRVYLQVDYDYTENRIGALSAHVTASDWMLEPRFDPETRRPTPVVGERPFPEQGEQRDAAVERRLLATRSRDVVAFQTQAWTGIGDQDTGAERQLVQQFLYDVVDAIGEVAEAEHAPIHFYVYSRSEMTQLVEACTRAGSALLSHLRELLGSRESLEQLIFSCVQDEVDGRFALGWTGRGLAVATSLSWFGQRYHWTRRVSGAPVELDRVFEQDIFDFKTTLDVDADGGWASEREAGALRHRFEIRSRFHDTLTAPYWRAAWRSLPSPESFDDHRVRSSVERYNRAIERTGLIRAYLIARVQALRWLEERIRFKNEEIEKPALEIARLQEFNLGIDTTGRAAVDFLRLDHHVGMTDWLTDHIQPPPARVQAGRTMPLTDIRTDADGVIHGTIATQAFGLTPQEFSIRTSLDQGFVRLSPWSGDPNRSQTLRQLTRGGITCIVQSVDWAAGTVVLDPMFSREATYVLGSWTPDPLALVFDHATLDESPSDYVAGRVESRLRSRLGGHVFTWFEPSDPLLPEQAPLAPARRDRLAACLDNWQVPHAAGRAPLTPDQRNAVMEGLETCVQLLKGPPGTGKTVTTAASILARIAARLRTGGIVLVAAHTHLAVQTLMGRLELYLDSFRAEAARQGLEMPPITLSRCHSSDPPPDVGAIRNFPSRPCATLVGGWMRNGVLVIGGTTSALLKMAEELCQRGPFRNIAGGFQAEILVVDEASMMVFPHFLSLATLVRPTGEIMLAGDNRQLAPIVAHDWENEDRPPAQYYQPFRSAYEAVLRIIEESRPPAASCRQSPLTFTFRLPPIIRELISRVYRDLDAIELEGLEPGAVEPDVQPPAGGWADIWHPREGLILVVHSERGSRQSNALEGELIAQALAARDQHPPDSVAIITPHRAQRALLRGRLEPHSAAAGIIDTVERLQGGERPTIIVSGTESDPHAIGAAASFILNLNRANVAFSRTQERLIVVCAETLLDHVPVEVEDYESALLWKLLRSLCSRTLFDLEIDGHRVRALAPVLRDVG